MYNLYFPICAFMISMLINLVFYAEPRVTNKETKCYSKLILLNLLESSLAVIIVAMALVFGTLDIAYLTNRIDYIFIVLWVSQMFKYFIYITIDNETIVNKIRKCVNIFNIIVALLIFSTDITLINESGIIDTTGTSTNIVTISAVVYLVSIIGVFLISLKNKKKLGNKILPMVFLIILFVLMVIIRSVKPDIVLISFIISYIDLIMFFTIENPDTKLVEEIAKSKEHADNYNAEKTYFIYNMTQEIKQPLTKVDRQLNSLINNVDDEDIKEELRNIEENVVNLNSIINGVLDISSIDSNKLNTINNKYSIELILKEIITNTKNKLNNTDVELRTEIDKNIPEKLFGDPIRLKQVINTILSNSIKYTKKGYIELNVSSLIKNDVCRLMIKIEDSGSGIKVDKLDTLFKRNKTENENNLFNENDSSELNLVNVRKILNIMGGTILINSDINSGTKITIVLDQKIVEDNKEEVNTIINDYNNDFKNHKILVIDENENNIKLITKLLEKFSIVSDSAINVKECFDKIEKNKYSLILLDDTLEKYSNFEILNKIKDITNTKVIALSKHTKLQYKDDYLKEGFSDYLQKPVSKKEIKEILEKYLK